MGKIDLEAIQAKINQNLPLHSESRKSADNLPPTHPIWELWQRMAEMYGHTWTSQQGEEPNDTWVRGLNGLTAANFGRALVACRDSGKTFPPTLPEFRSSALGIDETGWERQAHKIHEPERRLEDKTSKEKNKVTGNDVLTNLQGLF